MPRLNYRNCIFCNESTTLIKFTRPICRRCANQLKEVMKSQGYDGYEFKEYDNKRDRV